MDNAIVEALQAAILKMSTGYLVCEDLDCCGTSAGHDIPLGIESLREAGYALNGENIDAVFKIAARVGTTSEYVWGDDEDEDDHCYEDENVVVRCSQANAERALEYLREHGIEVVSV